MTSRKHDYTRCRCCFRDSFYRGDPTTTKRLKHLTKIINRTNIAKPVKNDWALRAYQLLGFDV